MDYIYVDNERIHLESKNAYQIYLNGKFIIGDDDPLEHLANLYVLRKTLITLGLNYVHRTSTKDNIIDGQLEIHNFKTQDQ